MEDIDSMFKKAQNMKEVFDNINKRDNEKFL
jgi:hypothetical protein